MIPAFPYRRFCGGPSGKSQEGDIGNVGVQFDCSKEGKGPTAIRQNLPVERLDWPTKIVCQ